MARTGATSTRSPVTVRTLADFRRAAVVGSRWRCVNHKLPHVSGLREITAGTTVLSYTATFANGTIVSNGRLELPRAKDCRIDGDSIHFLIPGTDEVAFTWTLITEEPVP
jgi:hypothetical protein